jgi:hypothetical protein
MKCEHEGCDREGDPCYMEPWDSEPEGDGPNGHFCAEHAFEAGFCMSCRLFFSGIESFDFGNGLCDNCRNEFDDDFYQDEDENLVAFCGEDCGDD